MPRKTVKEHEPRKPETVEPLLIRVNLVVNGSVYELDHSSKRRIEREFPEARGLPLVLLGFDRTEEFESLHGPLWSLAGTLLTGLSLEQIAQLGGIRIYYPREKRVVWEWKPSAN